MSIQHHQPRVQGPSFNPWLSGESFSRDVAPGFIFDFRPVFIDAKVVTDRSLQCEVNSFEINEMTATTPQESNIDAKHCHFQKEGYLFPFPSFRVSSRS